MGAYNYLVYYKENHARIKSKLEEEDFYGN